LGPSAHTPTVSVTIATDGLINPFGRGFHLTAVGPVFIIPLNLPLGVCMQRYNILLSLIVPRAENLWKNECVHRVNSGGVDDCLGSRHINI
jgi:hypothetical protein